MNARRMLERTIGADAGVARTQRIIAVGFAVVLLLIVALTGLGLAHMAALKAGMASLVAETALKTESVSMMRSLSRERLASLVQMAMLDDPFDRDDEYMRYLEQGSRFIRVRDRMLAAGLTPAERAVWERARGLIREDERLHAKVVEAALADRGAVARTVLLREVRPVENALLATFDALAEQYRQANQQALRAAEADYWKAAAAMLGLAAAALLIGLLVARAVILRSRRAEAALHRQSERALAAAEQLSWAASHDSLTGLANRREAHRRLKLLVQEAAAQGAQHVLLYVDLDQFKAVNDRCGHLAGDELLRALAAVFSRHVRSGDLVARLGGDEFLIGLANCDPGKGRQIAEAIRDDVASFRFAWEGAHFQVGASIGLVVLAPGMDAAAALKAADAACYRAKEGGRNRVCLHGEPASCEVRASDADRCLETF